MTVQDTERFVLAPDDSEWTSNVPSLIAHRATWLLTAPLDPLLALMMRCRAQGEPRE